jgi:hypothetical protein
VFGDASKSFKYLPVLLTGTLQFPNTHNRHDKLFSNKVNALESTFSNPTPELKPEDPNATLALTGIADNKKAIAVNNRTAKIEVGLMFLSVINLILTDYRVTFNAGLRTAAV